MTMRKYIITFAVTLASLCGHAQMNPLADSLFTHVLSMPFGSSDFDEKGICRILVQQTRGDLWLPSGWQKMKSWINGESVFYKELNE